MIEHKLRMLKRFNARSIQIPPGTLINGKRLSALISRKLKTHKEAFIRHIISLYLITIVPLVIVDGRLTVLGIQNGYYEGELNPFINYLFNFFTIDTVFTLRATFIFIAVAFLVLVYNMYPVYIKKYYLLLTVTLFSYLTINIFHIWVFVTTIY